MPLQFPRIPHRSSPLLPTVAQELQLEGGLPVAIQFDEPRAVTNGRELELHAWLVDSEGNPCDEQAARAFTWKLEAFDDKLVMLPVQKHGARPLRLNGSEITMRYGVLATSPLSESERLQPTRTCHS